MTTDKPAVTLQLTRPEAETIRDAMHAIGVLVPDDHQWTAEERRSWEKADRILRRVTTGGAKVT